MSYLFTRTACVHTCVHMCVCVCVHLCGWCVYACAHVCSTYVLLTSIVCVCVRVHRGGAQHEIVFRSPFCSLAVLALRVTRFRGGVRSMTCSLYLSLDLLPLHNLTLRVTRFTGVVRSKACSLCLSLDLLLLHILSPEM